jgi:DNA invertase Pin-like site-specific DNA recombinase
MLGAIAEFENEIRKDRQAAGLALARKNGVRFGRKAAMSEGQAAELRRRREGGERISDLVAYYGLSKATVYRYLQQE